MAQLTRQLTVAIETLGPIVSKAIISKNLPHFWQISHVGEMQTVVVRRILIKDCSLELP